MKNETIVPYDDGLTPPWEKQDNETPKSFAAFKTYRDLPAHNRSLAKAVKFLYGENANVAKLRQFQTWSSKYAWVVRVQAWDIEADRIQRETYINEVKASRTRSTKIGQALIQQAVTRIQSMKPDELKDLDLMLRVLNMGHRLEIEGLGMTGEETLIMEKEMNLPPGQEDYTQYPTERLRAILIQRRQLLPPDSRPELNEEK